MRASLVLVLVLSALLSKAADKELLHNGGFESGLDGWRALDLSQSTTFEIDTQVKHSERQSLRVARTGPGRPDFLKASVDLPARTGRVVVSMAFRALKSSHARLDVYFFDAAGETVGQGYLTLAEIRPSASFEVARGEYEIPGGATGFGINVVVDAPGTVWLDTASVTLARDPKQSGAKKPAEGRLENGRFDETIDGWIDLKHGSGTTTAKHDTTTRAAGAGSLALSRASARLFPEDGVQATALDVRGLKRLTLRLQSRATGAARAAVALQAFDARGIAVSTARRDLAPSATFASATLALEVPDGCERVVVTLAIRGAGGAWFDELVLEGR